MSGLKLDWILNGEEGCRYDNVVAITPFGKILITWKGWKEDSSPTVEEHPIGFFYAGSTVEEVQREAEGAYFEVIFAEAFKWSK